jgi:hypothetical protein
MKPGVTSVVVIGVAFMKKLSLGMADTRPRDQDVCFGPETDITC